MTLLAVMRRKYVTGAPVIDVTASNGVYWHSNPFTGIVPVTGTVKLPVMLQCTLSCTKAGALRHRSSLPYERASDQGLELELELQTQVLCGCRRMRANPTADRKISFRQVASVQQLVS